jgi:hypothetical protein
VVIQTVITGGMPSWQITLAGPCRQQAAARPSHEVDEFMTTDHHHRARGEYQRQRQAAAIAEASMASCHAARVGINLDGCPMTRPKMARIIS